MELNKVIGYDFKKGEYVVGSHDLKGKEIKLEASTAASGARYSATEVDELLATMAIGTAASRENHSLLGAQIVEPIMQVVPYLEMWTPVFFQDITYDFLEDNAIPVEDLPVIAYETHQDGAILYTKAGYSWTRPDFDQWDVGIEVPWAALKKAGWNFLARQMNYATWALARKRDAYAKGVLTGAIASSHTYTVSGGKLTKTAIDSVLKAQAGIGFPVRRVLINSGTIMDMATFTWPTGLYLPDQEARELIRNLYLGQYGGADFFINPFAPTDYVYFGGLPNQIGWHQIRGAITAASDVDITNKVDKHAISDAEHSWYVGNVYTLSSLQITA